MQNTSDKKRHIQLDLKAKVSFGNRKAAKFGLPVLLILVVSAAIAPALSGTKGFLPAAQASPASPDFNGDGFKDLAVGVPFEEIGPSEIFNAGGVNVIYGSASGLASDGNQFWSQNSPEILDVSEPFDNFGAAVTTGDFNNDGYSDLAVGVPREAIGASNAIQGAGAVNVIYGSASGLTADGNQVWTQNSPGILDVAESNFDPDLDDDDRIPDRFGTALISGDFNNDGYGDLAVGVPGESVLTDSGHIYNAGAVNIIYGSASGLTADGNQILSLESEGMVSGAAFSDFYGSVLASADLNGDGYVDLAVGIPNKSVDAAGEPLIEASGAVHVIYGSAAGLTSDGNQIWTQESEGILGDAGEFNFFGDALAAGDFNNDGYGDLAVGVPSQDLAVVIIANTGAVQIIYGSASGLTADGNQVWTQESPGILDSSGEADQFGDALAAGDFNNDGYSDLAVGVPGEDVGMLPTLNAGAVNVIYGSASGLTADGNQIWAQNSPEILNTALESDLFGSALATGDFNNDGYSDLAVGVPGEDVGAGPMTNAGAVNIIYGSASGLTAEGNQFWSQNSPGIVESSDPFDLFGRALA